MNRQFDLRVLRPRHFLAVFAMAVVVGLPLVWAQYALFGPSNRLLLGLAMLAGYHFLRHFMEPKHG